MKEQEYIIKVTHENFAKLRMFSFYRTVYNDRIGINFSDTNGIFLGSRVLRSSPLMYGYCTW